MPEELPYMQETQPKLEQLRSGTWAYSVDIFGRNRSREQEPLSPEDTQKRLNEALRKINKQGGQLVQFLKVNVKGRPNSDIIGDFGVDETALFAIVKK